MKPEKKMVKEDINFLEYPTWIANKRSQSHKWVIDKSNGRYELKGDLPAHLDKIVLYFLLYKLYTENALKKTRVITTRYEIAKNVFPFVKSFGKNKYDRIMKALSKWSELTIKFEGVFYDGDGHSIRIFHIINSVKLYKKTGALSIDFNADYLKQLDESDFYMFIDFEQYRHLQKSTSARLYEILIKSFQSRSEWAIKIQGLAEKLTFEKRKNAKKYYPSDVLRHVESAIKEINKKTELHITFSYNNHSAVCIFKCLKKPKANYKPAVVDKPQEKKSNKKRMELIAEFRKLPIDEQQTILEKTKLDPYMKVLDDEERMYAYMKNHRSKTV